MTPEHLQIHEHVIPLEVYVSELTMGHKDKNPITLLSFHFSELPPTMLDDIANRLWTEVARRYLILKKESLEKSNSQVIGRISFESKGTKVEYEFSRLTKGVLNNLSRLGEFLKQYPDAEEIRASRDGPILVRFRNQKIGDGSQSSAAAEKRRPTTRSWTDGLNGFITRYWRSRR